VYAPEGTPGAVVLFVSGDGGWNRGVVGMAQALRERGALVAGLDIRNFVRTLEGSKGCAYPAGALEELARAVQLEARLPAYLRPILVGYSSGATLVYAALAAAPPETFAGAISLGFCPDLDTRIAPCQTRGLRATARAKGVGYDLAPYPGLGVPWHVLQGDADRVCDPSATQAFVAATGNARMHELPAVGHGFRVTRRWEPAFLEAYRAIVASTPPSAAASATALAVADLGLVEVPAAGHSPRDLFAVILTGDGGWAEIDKGVAEGLAAAGIPSVGWSSLRYYWTPRTPESAARDLSRVLRHYAAAWGKRHALVVGYSFGADVLPFLVNRLAPEVRPLVAGAALLGPSRTADFEFHVSSWLGGSGDPRYETVPEAARLKVPVTCVRGADEPDSPCAALRGATAREVVVGHGHHFAGEYARIAAEAVRDLPPR